MPRRGPPRQQVDRSDFGVSGTFSIVAADPKAGLCGAAVASFYPAVGRVVPYVRAGVGAFCTQHWHNPNFGERALDLLEQGLTCEEVLAKILKRDKHPDRRQLAIVDAKGHAINRNPPRPDSGGPYWGAASGANYACQGNSLSGNAVIFAMAAAFEKTRGSLADKLMASLVAGERAGGDKRGRLAAGIVIAKRGVQGRWLELYVDKSDDAVAELVKQYRKLKRKTRRFGGT
jgi:uncharacterized Ntn-hydrolase superfamily protein